MSYDLELGLDIGQISKEVGAGVGGSISISKATATQSTGGKTCPKGLWTCAIVFYPNVWRVEGTKITYDDDCPRNLENPPTPVRTPYTVDFPKANSDGVYGGGVDLCSCTDYAHWADDGAPSIQCPGPCGLH